MIEDWVRYEDIKEKRVGYYVVYRPVFTGDSFALLKIHVYENSLIEEIKEIAEKELAMWAKKFQTPLTLQRNIRVGSFLCQ